MGGHDKEPHVPAYMKKWSEGLPDGMDIVDFLRWRASAFAVINQPDILAANEIARLRSLLEQHAPHALSPMEITFDNEEASDTDSVWDSSKHKPD